MPQSKLTDRTLKSLKRPKRGQVDYYDTDRSSPRGFGVRTSHTGAQTFFIKYIMPDGFGGTRQRRKMLETEGSITARYPEVSLADARELGFAFRRSLAAGKTAQDNGPRLPFGVLVTHYINNHAKAKKRSWKEDRRILNKYFADWHRHPADAITTAEIVERVHRIKKDHGPIMANRALAALRMAFKYTIQNPPKKSEKETYSPLPFNPAREVSAPGEEQEADRVFTDSEIKNLWKAFDKLGTAGAIYKLALVTGQRINEVRGLCEPEIEGDPWTLPGARTKNKKVHIVPLSSLALEIIEQQREVRTVESDLLFPSTRRENQPITVGTKIVEDVRRISEIADFSAHHLRRTVSTGITRLGFGRFIADRVLNHVEAGVGRRYDRYEYLKEKTEALEAWERHLRSLIDTSFNVVALNR